MKKISHINDPFPLWIIDNFLDETQADQAMENWPNEPKLWHSGHKSIKGKKNILEHGMRFLNKDLTPNFYLNLIYKMNSPQTLSYYEKLTGIKGLIADEAFRWSGLRELIPGGYQLIHSDARQHPETGYTKTLTHLLYLNDTNYEKEKHEGCLEIWSDDMSKKCHEIEPLHNRMVIFLNSPTSYHGVPKNNIHRKIITFSTITSTKTHERSKALFVARKGIDSPEIEEIGKQRADVEDRINKIN